MLPNQVFSETLQWELSQAGYHHANARKVFAGLRVIATAIFAVAAIWTTMQFSMANNEQMLVVGTALVFGYMFPMMVLRYKQAARKETITLSLPDALDLLVICVEAGQGLNATRVESVRM